MGISLTVGPALDGRMIAVISEGGHPQLPGSGPCTVQWVELVDRIPDGDTKAWFERMKLERPWEPRH